LKNQRMSANLRLSAESCSPLLVHILAVAHLWAAGSDNAIFHADLLIFIAAKSLEHGATLVTVNTDHFAGPPDFGTVTGRRESHASSGAAPELGSLI